MYQRLDRMLAQELRQGCADGLVMGGLGAYVSQHWLPEAEAGASGDDERALVAQIGATLAGYDSSTPDQRRQAVTAVRPLLARLTASAKRERKAASMAQARPSEMPEGEAAAPPAGTQRRAQPERRLGLDAPVTTLPGVNVGYGARLARLGVRTVRDLLYLFPHRYNDFSQMRRIADLHVGAVETVVGTVWDAQNITGRNGKVRTEAIIGDESGTLKAVWFNQPYMTTNLPKGHAVVLSGKVDAYLGRKVMTSPEYELLETDDLLHTGRLVPVYPLTEGVGARWMRRLQKRTLDRWAPQVPDHLPASVRQRADLADLPLSLAQMHFPDSLESLEKARRRLAFDELFLIQVGLMRRRRAWQEGAQGTAMRVDQDNLASLLTSLPFALTAAQERTLRQILDDIQLTRPMARLLQGDVGSGKTVVALLAMMVVVANGYQAAIMAPTEVLARQHFKTVVTLLARLATPLADASGAQTLARLTEAAGAGDLPDVVEIPALPGLAKGVRVARLIGSLKESGKQAVRSALAAGDVDIVIGTHALLEESVSFERLAFAVIDEQHRFGVMQRATLRQKGYNPHVLVMTATPIPRTLALTMYGDLDLSIIDELPPGRQIVKTRWLEPRDRERAYNFIRKHVQEGHQAFVICPLVEESEALETKAAVEEYERLRKDVFPDLRVGLVHGRLKPQEKDETMTRFARGELDILVATAVVEVGIDVPNATVMLIEGANHFGLAQLHQFRGRVGRGTAQSYCILLADASGFMEENPRLRAVEEIHDGFKLAEVDLELRGMGEFFGTRQSGLPDLKVARLGDLALLELARAEAQRLFENDPDLQRPEHRLLFEKVATFWQIPPSEGDLS